MEIEKSSLGKWQRNNDYRQESTMDVKISIMRNKVFASSQNVSPNKLWITKTKNFTVEKPGMYHLNHMVNVGSTSNKKHLYHAP